MEASRDSAEVPQTQSESVTFMWRTLAALFFAGGATGAISLLLPHPAGFDVSGLWTNVAAAFAASALCVMGARNLPRAAVHAALFIGTLLITRAVSLSDDYHGFYAFYYLWVGVYAFFFFGRAGGFAHTAWVGIAYGWVLSSAPGSGEVARWMMTVSTLAVGGLLVDSLALRLRELAAQHAALAGERATLMARLEEVARTDDLTGLPNRRAWDEHLAREVARARRDGTPLCVAVIDLDHFKDYNDVHGHQGGDRFLKSIAAAWRGCLRATDVLARYGGEEFSLALPGCDLGDARELVERLRGAIADAGSCSAGLAMLSGDESPAGLFARADAALYAAKASGRDCLVTA